MLLLLGSGWVSGETALPLGGKDKETASFQEAEVKARFKAMPCVVTKKYSEETRRLIRTYVHSRRHFAEDLLGRGAVYFPIIEQYLNKYNLPLDLRVLPIIETNFDPLAVSRAGATGLWQFMENTAEYFGLSMDDQIDERFDIHKSTEAAVQYLAKLYEKYQDWALTLAAYNCGPRYVNRAIKKARSRDYWTISRYLPRETQKYVPRFLAATYLIHYFHEHQLAPSFPELDLQMTQDVRLPYVVCMDELAVIANTPLSVLNQLNPAYSAGCIPDDPKGPMVTLPKRTANYVLGYYQMDISGREHFPEYGPGAQPPEVPALDAYRMISYFPQPDEKIQDIATLFEVEESLIRLWNNLEPNPVFDGERELAIYIVDVKPFHLPKHNAVFLPLVAHEDKDNWVHSEVHLDLLSLMHEQEPPTQYELHVLGFGERLQDVCRDYRISDFSEIMTHNPKAAWVPGEIIRIPISESELAAAR